MFSYKKGIVAVQFNWILTLIVGGLIILLFISIVQKQRVISEEDIAGTIQTDLQAILSSSQVSTGTASIIEMPNKEISFSCIGGMPGFKLGSQTPVKFPYAFAPDLIKSDRNTISVYAYDWSVPYKVTNFLYVTSPDIRYIIVGSNDPLVDDVKELLPPPYIQKDDLQKLFMKIDYTTDASSVKNDGNNYKIKFIFVNVGGDQTLDNSFKNSDVSAVQILGTTLDSGKLNFYELPKNSIKFNKTNDNNIEFVGKAALLAAIFSENKDTYECGMNNAIARLNSTSAIYKQKANDLAIDYELCSIQYGDAVIDIDSILSNMDSTSITSLESLNNQLIEASCPPIY